MGCHFGFDQELLFYRLFTICEHNVNFSVVLSVQGRRNRGSFVSCAAFIKDFNASILSTLKNVHVKFWNLLFTIWFNIVSFVSSLLYPENTSNRKTPHWTDWSSCRSCLQTAIEAFWRPSLRWSSWLRTNSSWMSTCSCCSCWWSCCCWYIQRCTMMKTSKNSTFFFLFCTVVLPLMITCLFDGYQLIFKSFFFIRYVTNVGVNLLTASSRLLASLIFVILHFYRVLIYCWFLQRKEIWYY